MRKNKFFIFILLAVFLIVVGSGARTRRFLCSESIKIMSPEMSFFYQAGHRLKSSFSFLAAIGNLKKENDELADKLTQLQVDESQRAELEIENQVLKNELGFLDSAGKGTLIPARIIERDPTTFLDYLVVDKGSNDGVSKDMPVVYSNALAGQVAEVYPNSAKITLITSKDSLVQVMLQNSRATGLLKGGISGLYMDNVVFDTAYSPGEYVITSGLDGKMKQGILVGKAGKTLSSSSEIYKTVSVDSLVDLSKIELVFIQK
jgi:rod shape-determining protein MreC